MKGRGGGGVRGFVRRSRERRSVSRSRSERGLKRGRR